MENMGKMNNPLESALSKQSSKNEELMFEISHARSERDRDEFEALSEEDKELLNKYFKIKKEIIDFDSTKERRKQHGKDTQLQSLKIKEFEMLKQKMENEIDLRPAIVNFLAYKEEEQELRNPHDPTTN